jgi:uncharacterized protein YjbJ (UPF0337 family)
MIRAKTGPEVLFQMNWDRIEGNWKQFVGQARQKWGKLTDSDWQVVTGKKDELVGRIQERYGIAREEARREADEWARTLKEEQKMEQTQRATH